LGEYSNERGYPKIAILRPLKEIYSIGGFCLVSLIEKPGLLK
jgi:hypothetical protein